MRKIKYSRRFRRDYRKALSGANGRKLEDVMRETLDLLLNEKILPARYVDHALLGKWAQHRDCHIRPNLVLIYRKPDPETLELVRLGSHSELGM